MAVTFTEVDPAAVYRELEHPADLFLEVQGGSFASLCEHALLALFDNLANLACIRPARTQEISVAADDPAEALRRLLTEALALFYTGRFLAVAAQVTADPAARPTGGRAGSAPVRLSARLWGETFDPRRHELYAEIKAVTRHQLTAQPRMDGTWQATVLFDV